MLYLRKEYLSLLGGTYHGSCILQGYVDEKRLKTPGLDECNGKLMEGLKTLKSCCEILISHPDEDVLLFSHQTSSMKHHLTETHEHNFEIYDIVLSSQRPL